MKLENDLFHEKFKVAIAAQRKAKPKTNEQKLASEAFAIAVRGMKDAGYQYSIMAGGWIKDVEAKTMARVLWDAFDIATDHKADPKAKAEAKAKLTNYFNWK